MTFRECINKHGFYYRVLDGDSIHVFARHPDLFHLVDYRVYSAIGGNSLILARA